jgi:16S rRNA (guanine966-N2)-methyltransferase
MRSTPANNSLRIIAGKWRSRLISFPDVPGLRPTGNRIRETLFNWLQNSIAGADCIDLFAGSGACGIEALSRGARSSHFLENNKTAASALTANLKKLEADNGNVICKDAFAWLAVPENEFENYFSIAFIDPPYAKNLEIIAVQALEKSGILKNGARIYLESDKALAVELFPANWVNLKLEKAGSVHYYLFERSTVT